MYNSISSIILLKGRFMQETDAHYAYSTITKGIVHIDDVPNGDNCECICLGCNKPLTAKHGIKNIHHFAHKVYSDCQGGGETLLHILAKEIFMQKTEIYLPELTIHQNIIKQSPVDYWDYHITGQEKDFFNKNYKIINKSQEKKVDDIIADLFFDILIDHNIYPIALEIAVTHFIDQEKINKLIKNNINCIEVNLNELYTRKIHLKNDINKIKDEIKKYINDSNNFEIFQWENQNIINEKNELKKVNEQVKNYLNNYKINSKYTSENEKMFYYKQQLSLVPKNMNLRQFINNEINKDFKDFLYYLKNNIITIPNKPINLENIEALNYIDNQKYKIKINNLYKKSEIKLNLKNCEIISKNPLIFLYKGKSNLIISIQDDYKSRVPEKYKYDSHLILLLKNNYKDFMCQNWINFEHRWLRHNGIINIIWELYNTIPYKSRPPKKIWYQINKKNIEKYSS